MTDTTGAIGVDPDRTPAPAPAAPGRAPLPRRRQARPAWPVFSIRTPLPRRTRGLLTTASILVPLAVWSILAAGGAVDETFLPSPLATWRAGLDMALSGQLWEDTAATVQRVVLGFGAGVLISAPLGILMGSFRSGQALLEPVIGLLRYLPASAFIPLLTIWLGLGEPPKIALLLLGTVFFNTLMIADAVRQVPEDMVNVSYTLGARRGEVLRKVIVPYALPGMIDAVRVNAAAAWNFVVVAELIASESGLGYRIARVSRFLDTERIFAVLIVIAVIGMTIDIALRATRDRVGRWQS